MTDIPSYELLGVRVDFMDANALHTVVEKSIQSGRQVVVGNHNLHSIYLYHKDRKMQAFYARADYIFVDSMPLVLLGRLLGLPALRKHRNTPIDWVPGLLARAATEGWRVFLLGSRPGVAGRAADVLRRNYPGLQIETHHGYLGDSAEPETEAVLARIREYQPHILCVGMGMPRQEHWIMDQDGHTEANVTLNVGALMDLIAGELPLPPRWVGQAGFEWLYRLVSRPGQVWRRYLVEPWFLLPFLYRDLRSRLVRTRTDDTKHRGRASF